MLSQPERHQHIIEKVQEHGYVKVLDLCKELNVSSVTIRKDLQALEDMNLLFRTHGGVTLSNPYASDKHVNEKEKLHAAEKKAIGIAAARLLGADDTIIIASGTTVQAFARQLQPRGSLTVLTAALNVALELTRFPEIEVIQLGGLLRKSSSSVTRPYAEQILDDFSCNKLFMGADGIDLEFGLSTTNSLEAHLNRKMMKASQKTIILADSSKFGKRGIGRICSLEDVDQILTDSGIPDHYAKALQRMGIEVTIV